MPVLAGVPRLTFANGGRFTPIGALKATLLKDANRREILVKHLWSAKGEDDEALGWLDAALHGT